MATRGLVLGLVVAGLVFGAGVVAAQANNVDFACTPPAAGVTNPCLGTVTSFLMGGVTHYSTSGINVWNANPYTNASPFTLTFNTFAGTIALAGTGAWAGQNLTGVFSGFSAPPPGTTTQTLVLGTGGGVFWPSLPLMVQGALQAPFGIDQNSIIYLLADNTAQSVDVLITPIPEPASLALMAPGLLGLVWFRHRAVKCLAV